MTEEIYDSTSAPRAEIALSWRRAELSGLHPGSSLDGLGQVDVDRRSRLLVAAAPVLDDVAHQLAGSRICVLLADSEARIVDRRVGDPRLVTLLDRISAVPGTVYDEASTGTNCIATPLEVRRGFRVRGSEHFLESLKGFSCYGHPIVHPVTRRLAGVIDITSAAADASDLFTPFLVSAAREIEERLLLGSRAAQQQLLATYQVASTRTSGPVVVVGEGVTLANQPALDQLGPHDFVVLRALADELGPSQHRSTRITLASGAGAEVDLEAIDRSQGALVRLRPVDQQGRSVATSSRRPTGGTTLTLVTGEAGTGRTTTAAELCGPGQVVVDALTVMEVGEASWCTHLEALVGGSRAVRIENLHLLPPASANRVRHLLLARTASGQVVATSVPLASMASLDGELTALASVFLGKVDLVALRHRRAEIPALAASMVEAARPGARLTLTPQLVDVLVNQPWPGNLHELEAVARHLALGRHGRRLNASDLPTAYQRSTSSRARTPLQQSEYDTIVAALRACGGNKVRTAKHLGIARATLYSRIRQFRIPD